MCPTHRFLRHAPEALRYYGVPLAAVVVAATQFFLVHATGLSRWKGGGFGMYSDYHELQHDLVLLSPEGDLLPARSVPIDTLRLARIWPTRYHLYLLGNAARPAATQAVVVQLWSFAFDLRSRELRRKLIAEVLVPASHPAN